MKRKWLAIGIILLFVGTCVIPSATSQSVSSNIITVDDEPGDADYTSIKEALNHSNPGDTIEVYSGTYFEYKIVIEIDNITLKGIPTELGNGSDIGKPFINGEGKDVVLEIRTANVTINGFHMENDGPGAYGMIDIYHDAHGCTISNNDISHTVLACIWIFSSKNFIMDNNISHSTMRQGIVLVDPSSNNFVSGNVICDCDTGILLWDSSHNLITKNIIHNCSEFGIDNTYIYNTFQYNTLKDNQVGYQTLTGVYNSIINNNFIDNQVHAQYQYNRFRSCFSNRWIGNFWDAGRILPYPIVGQILFFPWIQFDWHPAQEPYDIPGMT